MTSNYDDHPLVTYEDLDIITAVTQVINRWWLHKEGDSHTKSQALDLLHRLRKVAQDDAPSLPEGWVLVELRGWPTTPMWHSEGTLYKSDDLAEPAWREVKDINRTRITPMVPVEQISTEAIFEAAKASHSETYFTEWDALDPISQENTITQIRAALTSLGLDIEETP